MDMICGVNSGGFVSDRRSNFSILISVLYGSEWNGFGNVGSRASAYDSIVSLSNKRLLYEKDNDSLIIMIGTYAEESQRVTFILIRSSDVYS